MGKLTELKNEIRSLVKEEILKEADDSLKKNKTIIKLQRITGDRKKAEDLLKNNMDIFDMHKDDRNFDTVIASKIQAKQNIEKSGK